MTNKRDSDGKMLERLDGAAPLFNSDIGRKAALKRWANYTPKERLAPKLKFGPDEDFGIVYFVAASVKGKIRLKIGVTRNIQHRFGSLQTGSPIELRLGFGLLVQKPHAVEWALHKYFENKRVKGEWFNITIAEALLALSDFYDLY